MAAASIGSAETGPAWLLALLDLEQRRTVLMMAAVVSGLTWSASGSCMRYCCTSTTNSGVPGAFTLGIGVINSAVGFALGPRSHRGVDA